MASTGDYITKKRNSSATPHPVSEVTPDEKRALYIDLSHESPRQFIHSRSTVFLLIAVAFGLIAAVLAIKLFPV